jgi:hypothetical protein
MTKRIREAHAEEKTALGSTVNGVLYQHVP